jgi:hypothetical protein
VTKLATTIRFDPFYGRRRIRLWNVYENQWQIYDLDERISDKVLSSLSPTERARISRAQQRARQRKGV